MIIYAIKDVKAAIYLTPFITERNQVIPLRQFEELTNDPKSIINRHPEDFELHNLGLVNIETGEITPNNHPLLVATALDMLPQPR